MSTHCRGKREWQGNFGQGNQTERAGGFHYFTNHSPARPVPLAEFGRHRRFITLIAERLDGFDWLSKTRLNPSKSHPVAVSRTDFETFFGGARSVPVAVRGVSRRISGLFGKAEFGKTPNYLARHAHAPDP